MNPVKISGFFFDKFPSFSLFISSVGKMHFSDWKFSRKLADNLELLIGTKNCFHKIYEILQVHEKIRQHWINIFLKFLLEEIQFRKVLLTLILKKGVSQLKVAKICNITERCEKVKGLTF